MDLTTVQPKGLAATHVTVRPEGAEASAAEPPTGIADVARHAQDEWFSAHESYNRADPRGQDPEGMCLYEAGLASASLTGCDMSPADAGGADMTGASFTVHGGQCDEGIAAVKPSITSNIDKRITELKARVAKLDRVIDEICEELPSDVEVACTPDLFGNVDYANVVDMRNQLYWLLDTGWGFSSFSDDVQSEIVSRVPLAVFFGDEDDAPVPDGFYDRLSEVSDLLNEIDRLETYHDPNKLLFRLGEHGRKVEHASRPEPYPDKELDDGQPERDLRMVMDMLLFRPSDLCILDEFVHSDDYAEHRQYLLEFVVHHNVFNAMAELIIPHDGEYHLEISYGDDWWSCNHNTSINEWLDNVCDSSYSVSLSALSRTV